MFLKCRERRKDGKAHRSWSIVESRRCAQGRVVHEHVLYLDEINDSQRTAWARSIAVIDEHAAVLGCPCLASNSRDGGACWRG